MKKILFSVIFASFLSLANAQVTDTANVTVPGTLNKVAKAYLTTVTNLTVTGTIDVRDFETMKDSMTALTIINLSNATIAAYTEIFGTKPNVDSINNAANAIPQTIFYQLRPTLTSIILPTNITSIGERAFMECGLKGSLTIPSLVTYIGYEAFTGCYNLTNIIFDDANPSYCSINGVLFNKNKTTLIQCPAGITGTYSIPFSVDSIGTQAFFWCTGLTGKLTIPS